MLFDPYDNPDEWVSALKSQGYSAAYCPVDAGQGDDAIRNYAIAAKRANIVIAEVGVWNNPIHPEDSFRKSAVEHCSRQLDLAERIGASCCVNVSGSCDGKACGPHVDNFSSDTFDLIVETTRRIIDAVKPRRTFFTLELLPWAVPDSAESYLELVSAVDRIAFGVHFDPANLISSPRIYFNNASVIQFFVRQLGPFIKSCHAKDVKIRKGLAVQIDETRPGLGALDYVALLTALTKLNSNLPIMLEHLESAEDYRQAAAYIRSKAESLGIEIM